MVKIQKIHVFVKINCKSKTYFTKASDILPKLDFTRAM